MLIDPLKAVAEILGDPAAQMRNPVNAGYICPFINSQCVKTSHRIAGPYPVCTVYHNSRSNSTAPRPICVCPKRFYEADIVNDVVRHCWPPGPPPRNIRVAHEVKMDRFGNVDMVVADIDPYSSQILSFVSVELQAVDITGSVEPAYQAILHSQAQAEVSYGFNWKNVRKRFISQLIDKGMYHYHWGTRIVAVLQTPLYERLQESIKFEELEPDRGGNTVIFLLYDYRYDHQHSGRFELKFDRAVGTSHNSLMLASLYQAVPSKEEFHKRILANLV